MQSTHSDSSTSFIHAEHVGTGDIHVHPGDIAVQGEVAISSKERSDRALEAMHTRAAKGELL